MSADIHMNVDPEVELDLATVADLRPTCEVIEVCDDEDCPEGKGHHDPCVSEARWVAIYTCSHGARQTTLVCDVHHDHLVAFGTPFTWERL